MSIAEKLREAAAKEASCDSVDYIALALTDVPARCNGGCNDCIERWYSRLANAIEAELKASKPAQLPEGIEWPRYESGELVGFGDRFVDRDGVAKKVTDVHFYEDKVFVGPCDRYKYGEPVKRPEREVLDADGVPIKVGDTVWHEFSKEPLFVNRIFPSGSLDLTYEMGGWGGYGCVPPDEVTHRKPDSMKDLMDDAEMFAATLDMDDAELFRDLMARHHKLMGGE